MAYFEYILEHSGYVDTPYCIYCKMLKAKEIACDKVKSLVANAISESQEIGIDLHNVNKTSLLEIWGSGRCSSSTKNSNHFDVGWNSSIKYVGMFKNE